MTRIKASVQTRKRHKKVIKAAKGFRGLRGKTFKASKQAVMKAGQNAYIGRRLKKRTFRRLWITRINNAARANGVMYSRLVRALDDNHIVINRKLLADIAAQNPEVFAEVVKAAMKGEAKTVKATPKKEEKAEEATPKEEAKKEEKEPVAAA